MGIPYSGLVLSFSASGFTMSFAPMMTATSAASSTLLASSTSVESAP